LLKIPFVRCSFSDAAESHFNTETQFCLPFAQQLMAKKPVGRLRQLSGGKTTL